MQLPGIVAAVEAVRNDLGLPAVTVLAANADGIIHRSDHGGAASGDVWRLYSMTKLIGVIATLKLVERGQLALDQPVGDIAPEFDALCVLQGFDGTAPRLRPQRTRATIADLAHHRSGAVYGVWHEGVRDFMRAKGLRGLDDGSLAGLTSLPLAFDPGTDWGYGTGIDWLGLIIERVIGEPVEDFVRREVFAPCRADALFFAKQDFDAARLRHAHQIGADGVAPLDMTPGPKGEFYAMGSALFGQPDAYLNVLRALLVPGALLSAEMTASLSAASSVLTGPVRSTHHGVSADVDILDGAPSGFGLGGLIAMEDVAGRRRKGAYGWAGLQNTHFWVDPAAGVAGIVMMQHLPFADAPAMQALAAFERAVYQAI